MRCSFQAMAVFLAILFIALPARASDFCQPKDDKTEKEELEILDRYLELSLREHEQQGFSRPIKAQAKARAKILLEQNIRDKKVQLCSDRLKLAEDIKNEPRQWNSGDCASAAVIGLVDAYMRKVAQAYDGNQQALVTQQNEHLRELKRLLFGIVKGTAGAEGTIGGLPVASAPNNLKYEWIKQQATKLAGEAHRAWGAEDSAKNPLVQQNLIIAREALRAKSERDSLKTQFRSDGKLSKSCVRKP